MCEESVGHLGMLDSSANILYLVSCKGQKVKLSKWQPGGLWRQQLSTPLPVLTSTAVSLDISYLFVTLLAPYSACISFAPGSYFTRPPGPNLIPVLRVLGWRYMNQYNRRVTEHKVSCQNYVVARMHKKACNIAIVELFPFALLFRAGGLEPM